MKREKRAARAAARAAAPMTPLNAASLPEQCERGAHLIHDQVLQSLGLCLLQADLCRRQWENGEEQAALAELNGLNEELDTAIAVLRQVVSELLTAARAPTPTA